MIRQAKIGENVEIVSFHREKSWKVIDGKNVASCELDTDLGKTGTIVQVIKVWRGVNQVVRYISVKLDPPNKGISLFRPKELRRVK